jgi:hypothetical protein
MAFCGSNHHERILHVHAVAAFWKLDSGNRRWRSHIPVLVMTGVVRHIHTVQRLQETYFDGLVPTAGCQNATLWCLDPLHNLHRCIVLCHLLGLSIRDIKHACSIVCTPRNHFVTLLEVEEQVIQPCKIYTEWNTGPPCSSTRSTQVLGGYT